MNKIDAVLIASVTIALVCFAILAAERAASARDALPLLLFAVGALATIVYAFRAIMLIVGI